MKRRSNSVNVKHNSRYAKFDSREIKNYIEVIQYKINANANASRVASQAAFAALKASNKAYENINAIFIANIAIKEANIVIKEAIYSAKFAAIDAEQSYISAVMSLYKKQIDDLYYIIDKPNTPETPDSILSDDTHVTNRSNEFKSNKGNIVYIFSKCFKKKSAQIYDVSHRKKRKSNRKKRKSNILMKLIKYFQNDGDSEEEEDSDNEPE